MKQTVITAIMTLIHANAYTFPLVFVFLQAKYMNRTIVQDVHDQNKFLYLFPVSVLVLVQPTLRDVRASAFLLLLSIKPKGIW